MPTFVAMSSRNRWVAISTNGLLSGIRDSDAISALSLDPRAAHDERVDALVVPQEGTHVVLVDVHLGHVLRGDLRLPAPSAGGEEEAGERVPRHGDVLRDLLPEPFVEDAEIADRDVVHVFIVLVRHGLLDHALDQGRESDVDHEFLRRPHTKELITCFRCARHSFSAFAATASPSRSRSRSTTIVRNRSQCPAVMYGAVVPTSLYAIVTISWS